MATYNGDNNNNVYNGTIDSDYIYGNGGNDTLYGGGGNDVIDGGDGNDRLYGGSGNDFLQGGAGADTYIINISENNGSDFIYEPLWDGVDTSINLIKLLDVASTDAMNFSVLENSDLTISFNAAQQLTIGQYLPINYRFYKLQFSDGVIWNWQDIKTKALQATDGDDVLFGYFNNHNNLSGLAGNDQLLGNNLSDTLNGGTGNDWLQGFEGADTYLIAKNDGLDKISDGSDNSVDVIKFTDMTPIDLISIDIADPTQGVISIKYGNNSELLVSQYGIQMDDVSSPYIGLLQLRFANGSAFNRIVPDVFNVDSLSGADTNDIMLGLSGANSLSGGKGNDLYFVTSSGDTVTEGINSGIDTVLSSVNFTLSDNVENLALLNNAPAATGNSLGNALTGNSAANTLTGLAGNDILNGKDGNDTLIAGEGKDELVGGLGKDKIILTETTAATDTVKIATGDSKVTSYDIVTGFALGNGKAATGVDRLDLDSTAIAANVTAADGINVGIIKSHAINNGIISFDDADTYAAALVLVASNLADVFNYLKNNITNHETVAVNALDRTYVFQDGGITDTVVQLNGVTANNLNLSGLIADGIWLV